MDFFKKNKITPTVIEHWIKIVFQLFIILVGVFGNIYTIYGISSRSTLPQSTNILIAILSMALILQSSIASLDHINSWSDDEESYVGGFVGCDLRNSMNIYLPMMMNLLCFLCLLDRYMLLKDPVLYKRIMKPNYLCGMALLCFIVPAVVIAPVFYFNWYAEEKYLTLRTKDHCEFKPNREFALISPIFTFWIPLILIAVVIIKMFCTMERQEQTAALLANCSQEKLEEKKLEKALMQVPWSEYEMRYHHRLALTLWSAYWNVSIFWIPHHVWNLVSKITDANWPRAASFMVWCGYSPSMMLPLIYYYYNIYKL